MFVTLLALALVGLAFGSFVSALTWRLHEQEKSKKSKKSLSITSGRSQCPNCGRQLSAGELIPLLSWLIQKGRCRHCGKAVSWQYPALELTMAVVFVASYVFWPGEVDSSGDWVLFISWLLTAVGLVALLVYDARWMILPNKIIYPTFFVAAAGRLAYIIGFEDGKLKALGLWLGSLAIASGIFWALFTISKGQWIGFGDVRLGLITGTVLASPSKSLLMIVLASVLGTVFALPGLFSGSKKFSSKLPYGPFLIAATMLVLLFGGSIIDWYKDVLIP